MLLALSFCSEINDNSDNFSQKVDSVENFTKLITYQLYLQPVKQCKLQKGKKKEIFWLLWALALVTSKQSLAE